MKKYSSYKPSGVEWIGNIPESWDKKRLKNLTKSMNGFSFKSDDFDREFDIPVIRIGDVSDVIDFNNCVKVKSHFLEDKKDFLIEKDDILIGMTGGTIGKSGKYNYDFPSLLNQRVGLLRNNNLLLNGLLYHYVKSDIFIRYIFYYCYGGGQDNISMNDILNMVIPYPPLQEQEQIVNYLNEKTSIIDKLTSTKQRKIELLKEQRITLINQVITKGLNPNVKMKDSGVEWIGEIPEHWRFIPSKYFTIKKNGIQTGPFGTQLNTKDYVSYGVKVMNQKTLIDEDYIIGEEYISEKKFELLKGFEVIEGDIIMGTRGSFGTGKRTTFGKCSIVPKLNEINVLHPCLIRIRVDEYFIMKKFIYIYINESTHFLDDVRNTSNSTTIEVIYGITLKDIKFPIPPLQEQEQIVEYLDKHTKEIDDLVSMEQNKIDLLKEYRQSLISEVITGKIKVVE